MSGGRGTGSGRKMGMKVGIDQIFANWGDPHPPREKNPVLRFLNYCEDKS